MYPYVVITIYVRTDGWLIIHLKKITGDFFSNLKCSAVLWLNGGIFFHYSFQG